MMRKLVCMILVMVMALSLVACGNKEEKVVSTDGSTSMQKVISALGEAYMEETGAKFTYNATGSGTISVCYVKQSAMSLQVFLKQ